MERYFSNVLRAEKLLFPDINFLRANVKTLAIKNGDLSLLEEVNLYPALKSDIYIVFGSSFIKGWLADFLIDRAAINVHLGISPYYRGSSCNFWALYDKRPAYVGATLHKLSNGLDDGDIISHCLPCLRNDENIFSFTMRSVSAHMRGYFHYCKIRICLILKPFAKIKPKNYVIQSGQTLQIMLHPSFLMLLIGCSYKSIIIQN